MQQYLDNTKYINFHDKGVADLSKNLRGSHIDDEDIAKRCFEWVRDNIRHSYDYSMNPVTCKASDVLRYGTGYCYAKSHLLVAILRACNIPAGLCYQRLSLKGDGAPFCLHGLVALYLKKHGWYRVDPRGNKIGIDAQFKVPIEQLAFTTLLKEEADLPEIWPDPHPLVVKVLETYSTYDAVYENLPDIELVYL
ncbi:transglutaminase-like domain-containing protein [Maridesulfovibrio bastinii]|uniref:transglutaminase-like domain-containing protein n=1 Tax=Maridesulfovibrio bastinii TaxID=47157 RepID=UPI000409979D|nr:transglutaminase family protein [Maridesulfovibrio bastinii]